MWSLLKRTSAFLPVVISGLLLVLLAVYVVRMGAAREHDEGTGAHLFQLLLPLEVLIMAFFAFKWLPREPQPARQVLALQVGAVLTLLLLVRALHL